VSRRGDAPEGLWRSGNFSLAPIFPIQPKKGDLPGIFFLPH
jgi:hypothetical protein